MLLTARGRGFLISSRPITVMLSQSWQVQIGELRELGNVLQSRVCDLATALQVQAGELRGICSFGLRICCAR